jgi:hypothetical protein
MKKHHQQPDEITMRTILTGISNTKDVPEKIAQKCEQLFDSWTSGQTPSLKKSPPNIKDYNRLLKISVLAQEWKLMWKLVTDAPEFGPMAPDSGTYGVVLEGIEKQMTVVDKREREEHILSALGVWNAIIESCRAGKMQIDSLLVTRMGNLLVRSEIGNCVQAFFELIELTTGISRYDKTKKLKEASSESTPHIQQDNQRKYVKAENETINAALANSLDQLRSLGPKIVMKPSIYMFNTVLDACAAARSKFSAVHYYKAFQKYGLQPDKVNLNAYLRVLRETRSSKEAVEAVEQFMAQPLKVSHSTGIRRPNEPQNHIPSIGTFRIAMSACGRNRKNAGDTIKHANHLYNLRKKAFPEHVDLQVVQNYLVCIDVTDIKEDRTTALELVAEDLVRLIESESGKSSDGEDELVIELVKRVIGHMDKQENERTVPREKYKSWKPLLSNYVFGKVKRDSSKADVPV